MSTGPSLFQRHRFLFGLLALILLAALWCAVLWWGIAPGFDGWPLSQLVAAHALPPLVAGGGWLVWQRRRQSRRVAAAEAREAAAADERRGKLETARHEHAENLRRLRFGCDCRSVAVTGVIPGDDGTVSLVPEGGGIYHNADHRTSVLVDDDTSTLEHLRPYLDEALKVIYSSCPVATTLPIYYVPPADCRGDQIIVALHEIREQSIVELGLPPRLPGEFGRAMFLPAGESAADQVIGLFEANPELPGAVILAFDSPWLHAQRTEDDDTDGEVPAHVRSEQRKWLGQPGQGVFALLVTHPALEDMLAAQPRFTVGQEVMQPYWEKEEVKAGRSELLAELSEDEREALAALAPIARIHRATAGGGQGAGNIEETVLPEGRGATGAGPDSGRTA